MAKTPIIATHNLSRHTEEGTVLLSPTQLDVFSGDRLGIVGESGSGKTLLLRSLAALDPIQSGELRFHGQLVQGNEVPQYRTAVGYLPQRPVLLEGSVEHNLQLPYQLKANVNRRYDRTRVLNWLRELGRDETFLNKYQENLSGGELQLVALLRAIQLHPQVLLLDEPTAALDTGLTTSVEHLVNHWFDENSHQSALVWITHSMTQARRVCDKLFQMKAGQLHRDRSILHKE